MLNLQKKSSHIDKYLLNEEKELLTSAITISAIIEHEENETLATGSFSSSSFKINHVNNEIENHYEYLENNLHIKLNEDSNTVYEDDPNNITFGNLFINDIIDLNTNEIILPPDNKISGKFGSFNFFNNGDYSYNLDNNNPNIQTLDPSDEPLFDCVAYTVKDNNNKLHTSKLNIKILGTDDPVTINEGLNPDNLTEHIIFPNQNNSISSAINFSTPDGLDKINIEGQDFSLNLLLNLNHNIDITTSYGTISIIEYIGNKSGGSLYYTYNTNSNIFFPNKNLYEKIAFDIFDENHSNIDIDNNIDITIVNNLLDDSTFITNSIADNLANIPLEFN